MKPETRAGRLLGRRGYGYAAASLVAGLAGLGATALTGPASAKSPTTLGLAKHVQVKQSTDNVVVNARGLTVYTLSGERVHHLKCTKTNTCLRFWFPVKVSSPRAKLSTATGIKGKLGRLHRDGFYQVTLAGRPLYTFVGDGTRRSSATGEGIVSFGGTWHVVAVPSSSSTPPTTTTSTTPTQTTTTTTTTSTTPPRTTTTPYTTPTLY